MAIQIVEILTIDPETTSEVLLPNIVEEGVDQDTILLSLLGEAILEEEATGMMTVGMIEGMTTEEEATEEEDSVSFSVTPRRSRDTTHFLDVNLALYKDSI